jgi:hypothetical protein
VGTEWDGGRTTPALDTCYFELADALFRISIMGERTQLRLFVVSFLPNAGVLVSIRLMRILSEISVILSMMFPLWPFSIPLEDGY